MNRYAQQRMHRRAFLVPGPRHRDLIPPEHTGGNYSPENAARFVRCYRKVARGMLDALYVASLPWRCFLWLCPGCDYLHREDHDDVPDDAEFFCLRCGWSGDQTELRLGKK